MILPNFVIGQLSSSEEQTVTVTVVPGKLKLYSPIEEFIYNSRIVYLNLTLTSNATLRYARVTLDSHGNCLDCDEHILVTICTQCQEYGFYNYKIKPFDDGKQTVWFHTIFQSGSIDTFVNFTIDFKKPIIHSIQPKFNSMKNHTFIIEYSEENLQSITLFYGKGSTIKSLTRLDCKKGNNQKCLFSVNLSEFNGKEIKFWFEVTDYFNTVTSKEKKILVDKEFGFEGIIFNEQFKSLKKFIEYFRDLFLLN